MPPESGVPSFFNRFTGVVGRSVLPGVDGGRGTARLAAARRGTGGAPFGAGEPVLDGGNGDPARPGAGDPARERLSAKGEAAIWGTGEPTRERGWGLDGGGVLGGGGVCGEGGRPPWVGTGGELWDGSGGGSLWPGSDVVPWTSSVGVANDPVDALPSLTSRSTALSDVDGSSVYTISFSSTPSVEGLWRVALRISLRLGRGGGTCAEVGDVSV